MPRIRTSPSGTKARKPRAKKGKPEEAASSGSPVVLPSTLSKKRTPKKTTLKKTRSKKSPAKKSAAPTPAAPTLVVPIAPPPPQEKKSKTCMGTMQCFLYGGLVCIAGTVVLGLFLSIVVIIPLGSRLEQTRIAAGPAQQNGSQALNELEQTIAQPSASSAQNENGFYGTLLSKDTGVLMVQEFDSSLPLEKKSVGQETKTFAVRLSDKTGYTYQRPRDGSNLSAPLFTPEAGSFENLKTGMYVFVATSDDISRTETLTASHILYSEESPFAR